MDRLTMAPSDSAPKSIFDRPLLARRLGARGPEPDFITHMVIADLHERLATIMRLFEKAIILAPDARWLPTQGRSAKGAFAFDRAATLVQSEAGPLLEAEALALPGRDYDLIVSLLDLQTVTDVPGYLARAATHLAPDGLFMAAALGGRSLTELREAWLHVDSEARGGASARVAPMIDVRDAGGLLQRAGLALPVTDLETHTVRYADPLALMAEIKALGAANPLADRTGALTRPRDMMAAATRYQERYADPDGRVRATLEVLWLSGWAPHERQQKPLRPGSAQVSMTSVLGDRSER